MRGEYPEGFQNRHYHGELPPRARRIHRAVAAAEKVTGTTSACAENTPPTLSFPCATRNYLRVRGEYRQFPAAPPEDRELPPRARRIRNHHCDRCYTTGTTSACAENTYSTPTVGKTAGNYLRVRGEYEDSTPTSTNYLELPPRARRIPQTPTHHI